MVDPGRGRGVSRDAVMQREPGALARHIAADSAETIAIKDNPGYYGTGIRPPGSRNPPPARAAGLWRCWTSCTR